MKGDRRHRRDTVKVTVLNRRHWRDCARSNPATPVAIVTNAAVPYAVTKSAHFALLFPVRKQLSHAELRRFHENQTLDMKGLAEDPSHRRLIAMRPELRVCVQYISVAVCFPSLSLPGTAVMENKHISTWHSELLNCPPFISPSSLFPFIPLPAVYLFGSFSGPLTPGPITYPGATTPTPGSPYTLPRG